MTDKSRRDFESADDSPLPDDTRIRALLEQILETGASPEQVSGGNRNLERVLRERLRMARDVEARMEALFPTPHSNAESPRRALHEGLRKGGRLPDIPGYEIHSLIGAGGMGVVYRAKHLKLDRWVAIKMVLLGAYASREEMQCLLREAQNVAALRHPNIVQVYDVAEHDGFPFYAMELLDGGDLARSLRGQPRAAREAADLVRVLAGAVHAAHVGGIVHRDLKPGNILLSADKTPKIGDFSLATRFRHESAIATQSRQCGTPSYMSPEQAAGDSNAIQPAIDIYSLGAILYELLTGRPPFKAETSSETRRQVIAEEPVPPSRLNSRVPRDLQTICLKCLQKAPDRRYASAADLADDLERFLCGKSILARPVGAIERTIKWCRRRPSTAVAIAVSAAALLGAVAGGLWLQEIEHARQTQEAVRRESARASIEAALPSLSELVKSQRWVEAMGALRTAQAQLGDAHSPELADRLAAIEENFEVSQELNRARQSFLGADISGYTHSPAREAYSRIFDRVGIGHDVAIEIAAGRVRQSPLREELLVGLDLAAYAEHAGGSHAERDRLLSLARAAWPNPWQDRFRDPAGWGDAERLHRLLEDAPRAKPSPPSHQVFLIGLGLSKHDSAAIIEILREAQLNAPSDFWVTLALADTLRSDGNLLEALQFYRAATALQPANFVAWSMLGWTYTSSGNPENAIAPLKKAIALQPEYTTSVHYLLHAFERSDRWDEALALAREFSETHPGLELPAQTKQQLLLLQARSAAVNQDWSTASVFYTQARHGYPPDSHNLFELAAVSLLNVDRATFNEISASMLEQCEKADLRPFLVARACTLAPVSDQELSRASELVRPELDQHTNSHWSLRQRAALLCRTGNPREAIPLLERSLQSYSQPEYNVAAWAWLARASLSLGDHHAAKLWLDKVAAFLDKSDGKPRGVHVHDWLEAEILRRECETGMARNNG